MPFTQAPTVSMPDDVRKTLASTRASSFAFKVNLVEAHLSWSIFEALHVLKTESYVLVRKFVSKSENDDDSEAVVTRTALVQVAMESPSLQMPFASIVDKISEVAAIGGNESLEKAFAMMLSNGREEVCVMDQGIVRGVITMKCILAHLHKYTTHTSSFEKVSSAQHITRPTASTTPGLAWNNDGESLRVRMDLTEDNEDIEINNKKDTKARRYVRDHFSEHQLTAQTFCTSWCCELLVALCVIIDVSIGIADLVDSGESGYQGRSIVAMSCILAVFVYERTMRAYGFGFELLNHPMWVFDCLIVDLSALVTILVLSGVVSTDSRNTVTLIRVLRMLRIIMIIRNFSVTRRLRQIVSWQKTRFTKDGFDLDLTYITDTCIAMSLPAMGTEVHYRNPISEVQRFFATYHRDHFLIFNLCQERDYDPELFDGRVVKFDVEDHNPPRLGQIIAFLERAGGFMEEDPLNCIAVHCKGGKGRTGIMISAWLMYSQFSPSAADAMKFFETARTGKKARVGQGVSQPSQQRYVRYMEQTLHLGWYYAPSVLLQRIVIKTCPRVDDDGGCNPWFTIEEDGRGVFDSRSMVEGYPQMHCDQPELSLDVNLRLEGDVRVVFYDHDDAYDVPELCGLRTRHYVAADELCFFFWFHTGFVTEERTVLGKADVDVACHDHKCKVFSDAFAIELHFDGIPAPNSFQRGPRRKVLRPSEGIVSRAKALRLLDNARRVDQLRRSSLQQKAPPAAEGSPQEVSKA